MSEATTERIVQELWAWVVTDHLGNEGVLRRGPDYGLQPMISASREQLEQSAELARAAAADMRMQLTAARFVRFEDDQS